MKNHILWPSFVIEISVMFLLEQMGRDWILPLILVSIIYFYLTKITTIFIPLRYNTNNIFFYPLTRRHIRSNGQQWCFYHADNYSWTRERTYDYDRGKGSGPDRSTRLMVMIWLTSYEGEWKTNRDSKGMWSHRIFSVSHWISNIL